MTVESLVPTQVADREGTRASSLLAWFSSVDHKQIGILYICTALVFLIIGGLEAVAIRLQLAVPNNTLIGPRLFNQMFTMHGTTMVFLVGMPILTGFANYFVPLMIGARDVAFPRLNAFGYWLVPLGGILLHYSFLTGSAPNAGGSTMRRSASARTPRCKASITGSLRSSCSASARSARRSISSSPS
jgi:heme/copper-type cytochrome/quinol oxidase subunit 1